MNPAGKTVDQITLSKNHIHLHLVTFGMSIYRNTKLKNLIPNKMFVTNLSFNNYYDFFKFSQTNGDQKHALLIETCLDRARVVVVGEHDFAIERTGEFGALNRVLVAGVNH